MKENNGRGKSWLIIILVLLLLISLGYICYLKGYFNKTQVKENTESKTNYEASALTEEETNKLGEILFNKINVRYLNFEYYFFKDESIDYETMKNNDKLSIAFLLVPNYFAGLMHNDVSDESFDQNTNISTKSFLSVSKNIFEQSYFSIFGSDKSISYEAFDYYDYDNNIPSICKLESDEIKCYHYGIGPSYDPKSYIKNYGATVNKDGSINLVVKYLFYSYDGVYSDPTSTNLIEKGNWNSDEQKITSDEMFNKYGSKAGIFNVTFKKDNLGNYYWVSSQFVK